MNKIIHGKNITINDNLIKGLEDHCIDASSDFEIENYAADWFDDLSPTEYVFAKHSAEELSAAVEKAMRRELRMLETGQC